VLPLTLTVGIRDGAVQLVSIWAWGQYKEMGTVLHFRTIRLQSRGFKQI
jgi:hypothetical protein